MVKFCLLFQLLAVSIYGNKPSLDQYKYLISSRLVSVGKYLSDEGFHCGKKYSLQTTSNLVSLSALGPLRHHLLQPGGGPWLVHLAGRDVEHS